MKPNPSPDIDHVVDHMFREHYRYLVTALTAAMGPQHLQTVEDAVAEAMVRALRQWPHHGPPKEPRAWLYRVARNLCLDKLRKDATHNRHQDTITALTQTQYREPQMDTNTFGDDELAMLFMVGHPLLSVEARITLALKVVGGFSVGEIARAFLAKETAVSQRLVRARKTLALQQVQFEIPPPDQLQTRLETVLNVLYLMFTEGHMAHQGDSLVRSEICMEALRMTEILATHPATNIPKAAALAALMALTAARLPGRADTNGDLLLIQDQDRTCWDHKLIGKGIIWLRQAARGEGLTDWHLEAEIAACHSTAASAQTTDWQTIVKLYDSLLKIKPSPIIALNRAVASERITGPEAAMVELKALDKHPKLAKYYPYHIALAAMHTRLNQPQPAIAALKEALACCQSKPVQAHILDQLKQLTPAQD